MKLSLLSESCYMEILATGAEVADMGEVGGIWFREYETTSGRLLVGEAANGEYLMISS